ncbi:MAG: cyclic nucleotide-binding domain-containing protein [Candidatus Glassbacteria bacterium]|nr:cyclic nucleotide-binding domain-containing protein [Candidatus Glassbacteria bacterium]
MGAQLEKTFCRGEVIIKEGQPGSTFFVILTGMVEVLKRKDGRDVVIGVLGPSEFFGEMSLIDNDSGKRSATVRALEDSRVAIMSKEDFDKYLGKLTPGVRKLLSRLSERLNRTSSLVDEGAFHREKVEEDETLDFTMTLDELENSRKHAVDVNFMTKTVRKGQVVIRQGQKGQCGFIVKKGRLEVIRSAGGEEVVLGELSEGDIVGESAMFDDLTRSATVKAMSDGEVMVFGKRDMLNMARQSPLELFMIIDSLSGKIERTNEDYCDTLVELETIKKDKAKHADELKAIEEKLLKIEQENSRLTGELKKLQASRKVQPSAGSQKQI